MAPASTSAITGDVFEELFGEAVSGASMVTSEISQLPLSAVNRMFTLARKQGERHVCGGGPMRLL